MDPRSELDQIRQRAENATDGPWHRDRTWLHGDTSGPYVISVRSPHVTIADGLLKRDAEFIAAARSDVLRLVAALTAVLDLADRLDKDMPRRAEGELEAPPEYWRGANDAAEYAALNLRDAVADHLRSDR